MKHHINNYFSKVKSLIDGINLDSIEEAAALIEDAFNNNRHIFIIGNGGSAATASHMANDFSKGIKTNSGKCVKAVSLTDNMPLITAIGNDNGYENIFVEQLKILLNEKDLVILISASGNSKNILRALEYTKSRNAKTIGIAGFDGGSLKKMSDVCIHVESPHGWYGPVEDVHLIINHILTGYLSERLGKRN